MDISNFPSVLGNNTNIANVSEVSLQLLFHMASTKAFENEKWLNVGFQERFKKFRDILKLQGISVDGDIQVEVDFNLSSPVATNEIVGNMKAMREMGAISIDTVMEKCNYIKDVIIEKDRINRENETNVSGQMED